MVKAAIEFRHFILLDLVYGGSSARLTTHPPQPSAILVPVPVPVPTDTYWYWYLEDLLEVPAPPGQKAKACFGIRFTVGTGS